MRSILATMKILHTADVHLNDTIGERWQALVTVVAQAEVQAADVIVIAGDLFDHNIDARRLKSELRGVFDQYSGRVLIIPGNHDAGGIRPGDYYGERVTIMTSEDAVDIEDCRFLGMPFEPVGVDGTLERIQAAAARQE
jgi:metallophosphoesterase superfamily enzyme